MIDPTKYQTVQTVQTPGEWDRLAVALDVAMACDDLAQYRYLLIYGVEWCPLCTDPISGPAVTPSNSANTVPGK